MILLQRVHPTLIVHVKALNDYYLSAGSMGPGIGKVRKHTENPQGSDNLTSHLLGAWHRAGTTLVQEG